MSFYEELVRSSARAREHLLSAPAIRHALLGGVSRELYVAFLTQAYHHVRHTVPLMMAMGSRLPPRLGWLQRHVVQYIEEEQGHEVWILNDLEAAGGHRASAMQSTPSPATDAMVAYAFDVTMRRNPVGFFGMVHVLEGTSVAIALHAADRIQAGLGLPDQAFTYLRTHGQVDREHLDQLRSIVDRFDDPEDRAAVLQCARAIYWLYGEMFRSLDAPADVLGRTV